MAAWSTRERGLRVGATRPRGEYEYELDHEYEYVNEYVYVYEKQP